MSKDIFDPSWMNPTDNGGIPDPPGGVDPAQENNPEKKNLRLAAAEWIAANPNGYAEFVRLALGRLDNARRFGINQLCEVVRWEVEKTWTDSDGFKVNNNHAPYIARKLVEDHPRLEALIKFRKTRY